MGLDLFCQRLGTHLSREIHQSRAQPPRLSRVRVRDRARVRVRFGVGVRVRARVRVRVRVRATAEPPDYAPSRAP